MPVARNGRAGPASVQIRGTEGFWLGAPATRRPDRMAAKLSAGAHEATSSVSRSSAPGAWIARTSNGRVDPYERVLIVTTLAPRLVVQRRATEQVERVEGGVGVAVAGPYTRLDHGGRQLTLHCDDGAHRVLVEWAEG